MCWDWPVRAQFPCSTEHGPIEALAFLPWLVWPWLHFHALRSMAPLKPTVPERLPRTNKIFPCSTEHGPIEATRRTILRCRTHRFPCSTEHGPIEAVISRQTSLTRWHFHALRSMAPLKRPIRAAHFLECSRFPCSTEHGPIEARFTRPMTIPAAAISMLYGAWPH